MNRCPYLTRNQGTCAMQTLWQDLRFAIRMLKKNPGFTAVAVLTLALAIGANAVVFSVLNALILRPLNVPHAESLYGIQHGNELPCISPIPTISICATATAASMVWQRYNAVRSGWTRAKIHPASGSMKSSGNYFDVLGIQPYLGRFFHASDEHGPNSAPYIVLTYAYWHTHFQDDRGVVGRIVQLNKHPYTILGVAPPEFHGTLLFFTPDFFVPIVNQEQVEGMNDLNARGTAGFS